MTTTHRDELGPNTEVFTASPSTQGMPGVMAVPYAASPASAPDVASPLPGSNPPEPASTAPAVRAPTWSGKKTAIAAALAIGLSSAGAIAAVAAVPAGTGSQSGGGPGGQFGPGGAGGRGGGGFGPGQQGQFGQQGTLNQQGQTGAGPGQLPGQADPNAGIGSSTGTGAAANGTTGSTT